MPIKSTNITRVHSHVHLKDRWARHGHRGGVLWFTGLARSGKTSLALGLEKILFDECYRVRVLHSQNFRIGLSSDLGFSREDRREHIRRVGEVAAFLARRGVVAVTSFISPFALDRANARAVVGEGFHEVFLDPGLAVCEERDTDGIYARARVGEIPEFTGVSDSYEAPKVPELRIDTGVLTVAESLDILSEYATRAFRLPRA